LPPMYQHKRGVVKGGAVLSPPLSAPPPGSDHAEDDDAPTIVIEDEGLRAGFTQLPNYVFRIRGLSHGAKLTYALLLSYAWQSGSCFPGQATLAADLDVSVRSVGDYLRELQERGLIRIQRRGLGKTNIYHILRLAPTAPPAAPDHPAAPPVPPTARRRATAAAPQPQPPVTPDRNPVATPDRQNPAHQHRNDSATPGRKRHATLDTQPAAPQKDASHATKPSRKDAAQQHGPVAASPAQAVLARFGVTEPRLVAELCASPAEVLRQAAALQDHLDAGHAIANPAGWLIEAVRGGYQSAPDTSPAPRPEQQRPPQPPPAPPTNAWEAVKGELQATTTEANFQRWFASTVLLRGDEATLIVGAPSEHDRDWLEHRLRGAVERAATVALGAQPAISFVTLPH